MTNPAYRHLIVVADRSGSMGACREATQEGIDALFAEQATLPGHATASLFEFDTEHDTVFAHVPLDQAPKYTLVPRGGTALLDAIGFAFTREGEWLASLPEDERPGHVIAVIATDGEENSSKEYTLAQVRDMVGHQQSAYAWQVLFVGANIDAIKTGAAIGVAAHNSMTYAATASGTASTFAAVSANVTRGASGLGYGFSDTERSEAVDA